MFFLRRCKKQNTQPQSGFSLIELMVTISIVTLITVVVMVKYSSFNNVVILKSQAYELALDIREAQVFGVSVSVGEDINAIRQAYGIYVDLSNPKQYMLFRDSSNNLLYDPGEEIGELYTIDSRFTFLSICTITGSNSPVCGSDTNTKASIAFKRPDFDAKLGAVIGGTTITNPDEIQIKIAIASDPSQFRTVSVYSSGQISVQ